MYTKLNILGMGLKKCFNPKAVTCELGSLSTKDYLLLAILLASQVVSFVLSATFDSMSILSRIVGIVTIVNLILVNRGRLTNFTFGIVATVFWLIVAVRSHLVGAVFSQSYSLVMQFIGIYAWQKDM